jgi:hypothetical protein
MTNNKSNHEAELKAAKRAEIERLWFAEEATNEELLQAYKSLDAITNSDWFYKKLETMVFDIMTKRFSPKTIDDHIKDLEDKPS